MQIHLTFDYELFFGADSGTVQNCLLKPTQQLIEIAKKHEVKLVFYIDAGFLYQLKQHSFIDTCRRDYELVAAQIKKLSELGHEIGLHIHPHWEDSFFENGKWKIDTVRYKLSDFEKKDVDSIITKYHQTLVDITEHSCQSYRAGGWCVQPFHLISDALIKNGIYKDTSVYHGGVHLSSAHSYDFSQAPDKDRWKFESDPCVEAKDGQFMEIPTTSDRILPFFYWNLYLKMRYNPAYYKPVGDGSWLVDRKRVYKHFFSSTNHIACADGFFASRLWAVLKRAERQNREHLSILSHPKSLAPCSFEMLDKFIGDAKAKGHICTTIASV